MTQSCTLSPAVRVLTHSEKQCQGGFEKCQWASFPRSHTCSGIDSLLETKTWQALGHKIKKKNRKEEKREKRKKEEGNERRRRQWNNKNFVVRNGTHYHFSPLTFIHSSIIIFLVARAYSTLEGISSSVFHNECSNLEVRGHIIQRNSPLGLECFSSLRGAAHGNFFLLRVAS